MRWPTLPLAASCLSMSCLGPWPLEVGPGDAICDGILQRDEDVIDGPFDADGDGFVDGSNPDCARAYAAHLLDCDDTNDAVNPARAEVACNAIDDDCNAATLDQQDGDGDGYTCDDCDDADPERNPGQPELCGDNVDNDCDGEADLDCPDYNGTFVLDTPVAYSCAFNFVNIVLDELRIQWAPAAATLYNITGNQPPTLPGIVNPDGTFLFEDGIVIGTPASCDEYYRLSGTFSDEDTFSALFEVVFVGGAFACGDCAAQSVSDLVGRRQ